MKTDFINCKVGDTIYIYDRFAITLSEDKITNISKPYDRYDKSVVDITIGDLTYIFTADAEIGFTSSRVIATNKTSLKKELQSLSDKLDCIISTIESI
ncbi:MAG: hypothetical protein MJZ00_06970 [Paludibacteraceae bacterium]|nr:hypothetical protein [Paludibacteraceae bacterium]